MKFFNYNMKFLLLLAGMLSATVSNSQKKLVDTVDIFSASMHRNIKAVVIKPEKRLKHGYPVLFLLHGYSGAYNNWIKKMPDLPLLAKQHEMIIVCPDGGYSSWYINAPEDSSNRFETFISKELVDFVDRNYRTIPNKQGRAIDGLSMGGHGALSLAMNHQETFGAAGSMSGAVDLRAIFSKYGIRKNIGDSINGGEIINHYSVMKITDTFSNKNMPLIIDCGIKDQFISHNRDLHLKLLSRNLDHTYIEREGGHTWNYWTNALPYHLLFFRKYFSQAATN